VGEEEREVGTLEAKSKEKVSRKRRRGREDNIKMALKGI
jgi:hypothetical protein